MRKHTNPNFQKLEYLKEDALSRELEKYELSASSFGQFHSPKTTGVRNMVLPYHRIIYVTSGPLIYTIGGSTVTLRDGDVLYTPPNTVYSAKSQDPSQAPGFLYLYFHVMPHHLNQDFIRLIEASDDLRVFHASHSMVEFYFHTILEEYQNRRPGYYKKIHSFLVMIIMELLRNREFKRPASSNAPQSHTAGLLNKATSYIAGNLTKPLRVGELGSICGVSETCLYKLFKSGLNLSPQEYILNCKMEYAAQLLRDSDMTVTQIARELAFSSSNHFSNTFFRIMHVRPSEYRKRSYTEG